MLNRAIVAGFLGTTAAAFGLPRPDSGDSPSVASTEGRAAPVEGPLQMTSNLVSGDTERTKPRETLAR